MGASRAGREGMSTGVASSRCLDGSRRVQNGNLRHICQEQDNAEAPLPLMWAQNLRAQAPPHSCVRHVRGTATGPLLEFALSTDPTG